MTVNSSNVDQIRLARIALAHLVEPGSRELGEMAMAVGPVEALRRLTAGQVSRPLADACVARLGVYDPYLLAGKACDRADRLGVRIATPEDEEWPPQLDDLVRISEDGGNAIDRDTYPPHAVWLRGPWRLAQACEQSVALVGARASTPYGDHVAADLGFGLAQRGWTVISGGAFGIDAAAHRGALGAGGPTIAVLACGIDRPYPLSHVGLFDRVGEVGLLLSEWPPGADPHRRRFLVRNRVIAALARGTVIVEANIRSGARFTFGRARMLNRVLLAVPGPVTSAMSVGCHEELRLTDTILAATVAHVVDAVGRVGEDLAPVVRAEETPRDRLTPTQRQVLDGVRPRKVLTAEDIAAAVGVPARQVRCALPELMDLGFIVAQHDGYRLARKSDGKQPGSRTARR